MPATPAASGSSDARSSSDSNGSGTVSQLRINQDTTNSSQSSKTPPLPPPSPSGSSFVSRISTAAAGLSSSGLPSSSLFRRPLQASRSSSELGHLGSFHSSGSLISSSSSLSPGARNWAVLVQKLTLDPIQEPADPAQLETIRNSYKSDKVDGATSTPTTTTIPESVIEKLEVLQRYEARFPGEDTKMSERWKSTSSSSSSSGSGSTGTGANTSGRGPEELRNRRPSLLLTGMASSTSVTSSTDLGHNKRGNASFRVYFIFLFCHMTFSPLNMLFPVVFSSSSSCAGTSPSPSFLSASPLPFACKKCQ